MSSLQGYFFVRTARKLSWIVVVLSVAVLPLVYIYYIGKEGIMGGTIASAKMIGAAFLFRYCSEIGYAIVEIAEAKRSENGGDDFKLPKISRRELLTRRKEPIQKTMDS